MKIELDISDELYEDFCQWLFDKGYYLSSLRFSGLDYDPDENQFSFKATESITLVGNNREWTKDV